MISAHGASTDITLLHLPEPLAIRIGLVDLTKSDIHEVVTIDEMTIECLAILQLD